MILAREREAEALELRKAGATFEMIGKRLGIATSGAELCVKRALAKIINVETLEEVRALELARCDSLHLSRWKKALAGDEGSNAALDRVMKVMERRARLTGVDAPVRAELGGEGGAPLKILVEYVESSHTADPPEPPRRAETGEP